MLEGCSVVVVGAGFFGATIAERVANDLHRPVGLIERRRHVGGAAYSEVDRSTGIEVHKFGTHVFHTSSEEVWSYIRKFAEFNDYRHRVVAHHGGQIYSLPFNLHTISTFFGRHYSPLEARQLIADHIAAERIGALDNLEAKAVSAIGRPLYEAFVRGYTLKQWGIDPKELPKSIIERLAIRFNFNDRYFSDRYEGVPIEGYSKIFERMLASPLIRWLPSTDFFSVRHEIPPDILVVYTGPIDRFFDCRFGALSWRTLRFENETLPLADYQGTGVVNYPDLEVPFTRIHEFRHLHPERKIPAEVGTIISREYSSSAMPDSDPFYPIGTVKDRSIYELYRTRARELKNTIFGGRLGTYRYLDMHQAIGAALMTFQTEILPRFANNR